MRAQSGETFMIHRSRSSSPAPMSAKPRHRSGVLRDLDTVSEQSGQPDRPTPGGWPGCAQGQHESGEFDPGLAEFPTRTVTVDALVDLMPAPDFRVAGLALHFRDRMLCGDRFPPIAVIRVAGRWVVTDGHKRLTAYKGLAKSTIVVQVWTSRRFFVDHWNQFRKTVRRVFIMVVRKDPAGGPVLESPNADRQPAAPVRPGAHSPARRL